MFDSSALEIGIGLVFIYLLLSLACTACQEIVAGWFELRSKNLAKGLRQLLSDPKAGSVLADKVLGHPAIARLGNKTHLVGSYVDPKIFVPVLIESLRDLSTHADKANASVQSLIDALPDEFADTKKLLTTTLTSVENKVGTEVEALGVWFDKSMDRVSGWYKKQAYIIGIVISLVVCGISNADTLSIAHSLSSQPALRAAVADRATAYVEANKTDASQPSNLDKSLKDIQESGIPLGWGKADAALGIWGWISKFLGIAITALCVSLGAPFWFDMLSKLVNLRMAGQKPDPSKKPA